MKKVRFIVHQPEDDLRRFQEEDLMSFFDPLSGTERFWQPHIDVFRTGEELVVKAELAGARSEDINVCLSADGQQLTISGVRAEDAVDRDNRVGWIKLEVYYGPFERRVMLPGDVQIDRDRITAKYRDGFLVVRLPLIRKKESVHRIAIEDSH